MRLCISLVRWCFGSLGPPFLHQIPTAHRAGCPEPQQQESIARHLSSSVSKTSQLPRLPSWPPVQRLGPRHLGHLHGAVVEWINSPCLVSTRQMPNAPLGSPWPVGENKVRLLSCTKDRKINRNPRPVLRKHTLCWEVMQLDAGIGTRQGGAWREGGQVGTAVFSRATPLWRGAPPTQLQKILAI